MEKDEETEISAKYSALFFYLISKLNSEATSLFDVGRWTFDVGR